MIDNSNIRPCRSFIFTPGLRPYMYHKALASRTDIVCVELEDRIAPKRQVRSTTEGAGTFC